MGNRVNRAASLAHLQDAKQYRISQQYFGSMGHSQSKTEYREGLDADLAILASAQAAMIRNRLQSAQAQSEQQ